MREKIERFLERFDSINCLFIGFLLVDVVYLLCIATTLSISTLEVKTFFYGNSLGGVVARFFVEYFGNSELALRTPFIFLHILSLCLLFMLSKCLLKRREDALYAVILYAMLPGVNAAALLVMNTGFVINGTLLLCLIYERYKRISYGLLCLFIFLDPTFSLVFLSLFVFAMAKNKTFLMFFALLAFGVNMFFFGSGIVGRPSGHFLDSLWYLSLIFTPIIFIFYLYAIYRFFSWQNKPLLWFIVFCSLCWILIFSLRQKVRIDEFASLLVVGVPLMVYVYYAGLRVRLTPFKARYKIPFMLALCSLIASFCILAFSKPLFLLYANPREHFAYGYYWAREIAGVLKDARITKIICKDTALSLRLRFYGIESGGNLELIPVATSTKRALKIYYWDTPILAFKVSVRDSKTSSI